MSQVIYLRPFDIETVLRLRLGFPQLYVLTWFMDWADDGTMLHKTIDGLEYYWVKPSKAIQDLPLLGKISEDQFRRIMLPLYKNNGPLLRKIVNDKNGKHVYFAKNLAILQILCARRDSMKSDSFLISLPEEKPLSSKNKRRTLNPNVEDIIAKLAKLKINDVDNLFRNKLPSDSTHYTKSIEEFSNRLWALYMGTFEKEYPLSVEFEERNKRFITKETEQLLKTAKGSWVQVEKIVLDSAKRYIKWFLSLYEPENKDWLPDEMGMWVYDRYHQSSLFYLCLVKDPDPVREVLADRAYESLSGDIQDIAETLYKKEWDAVKYWNQIKSVVVWYKERSTALRRADNNISYWFEGGINGWFTRYIQWLKNLGDAGGRGLFLKQVGTNNNTWNAWLTWGAKEHGIVIDMECEQYRMRELLEK
jgi:hypothetical protein